jgi:hypothetical protein
MAILSDNTIRTWSGGATVPAPIQTLKVVTAPTITPGGRVSVFPTDVTINCDTFGAVIHYNTTGAEPTESDPVIAAGNTLRIDRTMVLKVKAWKPGLTPSQTVTAGYTVLASASPAILIEDGNTNLAAALDSVTLTRGPFRVLSDNNFSADHHTRVILFTANLGLNPSDTGLVTVQAAGFPLTVENVGQVSGVPGLSASFIIVRLPVGLPAGEHPLIITVRGQPTSNSPVLGIAP